MRQHNAKPRHAHDGRYKSNHAHSLVVPGEYLEVIVSKRRG
ncbi:MULTISPECIES: hypothetical protein [unclassified Janthinobacterium]|nr:MULTISPECIES: hypothetical protein [unclassified Janthinobacterium]